MSLVKYSIIPHICEYLPVFFDDKVVCKRVFQFIGNHLRRPRRFETDLLDFGNFGTCSEEERRALTIDMVRGLIKSAWKGYNRYVVKK